MGTIRDYSALANNILTEVGGEANLVSFSRCATRLRLVLKEVPESAVERVKNLTGVITVVLSGGQFQVVIGTHVADVYQAFSALVDSDTLTNATAEKKRPLDAVVATMSAVFAPVIYVLAAAGLLQGLLIIINYFSVSFHTTGTFGVLNFISWTPFAFLPVFIAITAAKHFKCNTYIAVLCCCALINPDWAVIAGKIASGEGFTFLGIPLAKTVYTSSVLPPLFLVWGLAHLERLVLRVLPDVVAPLFTPLICVVVMVPVTLVVIGPVTAGLANGIAHGYNWLFNAAPPLAAAVIGGVWQVIVIFGVHWGITPVIMANFDMYGRDSFQAFQTMAVVAQMAAAFACAMKTRQAAFRPVAWSAGLTGVFGITEPSIYGVTLRLKKPFICGCIGGATGACVASFFGSYYYAYAGLPGLLTIMNAISPENPQSFIGEVVGLGVTVAVTFALVFMVGFTEPEMPENKQNTPEPRAKENMPTELVLNSPVSGKLVSLSEVNDETFASKLLGDGIAILPDNGVIIAPCDGEVASVIDSQHAVGMLCANGAELLIHVGLDTVKLQGAHFTTLVKIGDYVTAGTPLIQFDKEKVIEAGYDITTPVLVVNSDEHALVFHQQSGKVDSGNPLFSVA
ncbi:beta-glucoside-specific PTS transporter subunit IIABC [Mangrovibacter plantisponsor]|uniref:PTS system beta-glucoside-specific IIA component (Glc family) /PTS system beta-glucoside-specific IIB component (Glc family) /PTS system beta-glucoside-specific IIC component (Glc family) n=1 Tax=Mangrovibacter plantisponsor TaxID=451513 RepID=A0A317Q0C8_9ENTR|nr:beta-glucoside-specific PTS transporter subunit IIABC [Mangrovibacter plantisponsor]PWW07998.1 PTS system beta-glucoside-specific IIA component (Glc family) /PTS system beta-glucoside-specific IIB component (Glc family) /PTS system beta-glucoside-specific IIC component (Glc family) [Mangrovibacter plantisponsor]